jgi:hypothetical protein
MSEVNTGGPAFPFKCQGPTTGPEIYYGMTLRDYFAAKALEGKLATGETGFDDIAKRAYKYADAMLKAREQ